MKYRFYILIFCGILIAVLINLPEAATKKINAVFRDAIAPFTSTFSAASDFILMRIRGRNELIEQNVEMTAKLEQLQFRLRQLKALEYENCELRRLLRVKNQSKYPLISCSVITRTLSGWSQKARLNKGSTHDIMSDLPVIASGGLAGKTAEVSSQTCDILLLGDPACKIPVRISRLNAFGILHGKGISLNGKIRCEMSFILKESDIILGDEVVTSGLGSIYPSGLLVGYVKNVYMDESGLCKHADIIPAVDFRALNFVFVLLSEKRSQPQ